VKNEDNLARISADDELLSALAHGETGPDGDELAAMFAAWRADLDTEPAPHVDTADLVDTADASESDPMRVQLDAGQPLVGEILDRSGPMVPAPGPKKTRLPRVIRGRAVEEKPTTRADVTEIAAKRPARARPRGSRLVTGIAAALLVLFGGMAVAANRAGPTSPLWPLTQVMYPEQADVRAAEHALEQARQAIDQRRFADADHRLDQAAALIAKVRDQESAQRLRAELQRLRGLIPAGAPSAGPSATPAPTPVTPQPTAPDSPGPRPSTGDGGNGQNPGTQPSDDGPGLPLPTLPGLPLPTLPGLPLPSLPIQIPPLLPS
jgi:hypothetical protein